MGAMPGEQKTKMVMGLRMEYMSRSAQLRRLVLERLQTQGPFEIARTDLTIEGEDGQTVVFNLLNQKRKDFANALDQLFGDEMIQGQSVGSKYLSDHAQIRFLHNKDHTGNRERILDWWESRENVSQISDQLRQALQTALMEADGAGSHITVWWVCDLSPGEPPRVEARGSEVWMRTDETGASEGGPIADPADHNRVSRNKIDPD